MHSLHNLMCMEHYGHTFFYKNNITDDNTQLPIFFDYCSQVVEAFLDTMAEYGIEFSYQEFYVMNELIDNFSILLATVLGTKLGSTGYLPADPFACFIYSTNNG